VHHQRKELLRLRQRKEHLQPKELLQLKELLLPLLLQRKVDQPYPPKGLFLQLPPQTRHPQLQQKLNLHPPKRPHRNSAAQVEKGSLRRVLSSCLTSNFVEHLHGQY
ncbi:hypothetical protein DMN91_004319, partial [Ooceraea biroi]